MSLFYATLMHPKPHDPEGKAKLLASLCYQSSFQDACKGASKIPLKKGLFKPGHHTPFESTHWQFFIENIPVSMVTFGLHMTHPFYNSLQRSGRYCYEMFSGNTYKKFVSEFVDEYCPETGDRTILNWVVRGVEFFNAMLPRITAKAKQAIRDERPYFMNNLPEDKREDAIDKQAKRIAQEQLRCIISTIFPTGLSHDIDTITLASMYHAAWNEPLKDLLRQMIGKALEYTGLSFVAKDDLFDEDMSWCPTVSDYTARLVVSPHVTVTGISEEKDRDFTGFDKLHGSLDLLQFSPKANTQKVADITSIVAMSVASYGQDQRHRTVSHGNPIVTGDFYLPPLLRGDLEIEKFCQEFMNDWLTMVSQFGANKLIFFIPYGAVVSYVKKADNKSYYHELSRRKCLKAQEEICHVANLTDNQVFPTLGKKRTGPPCIEDKCLEAIRCGRDMSKPLNRNLL